MTRPPTTERTIIVSFTLTLAAATVFARMISGAILFYTLTILLNAVCITTLYVTLLEIAHRVIILLV